MSRIAYEFRPRNLKSFLVILNREVNLYWRNKNQILESMLFFLITIIVSHIMINKIDMEIMLLILLFSIILSSSSLINNDFQKGFLTQFLLLGISIELILLSKVLGYLLLIGIPFSFIIFILQYVTAIDIQIYIVLPIVFLMTANVILVCLFAHSLCLSQNRNPLINIIIMPLIIPTMIFASVSIENHEYIMVLVAILCFKMPIFLLSSAAVIRLNSNRFS